MILGMTTFTLIHVLISLAGIASGFVVLFGWLADKRLGGWTAGFLGFTILTSVTGFFFRRDHILPSHIVGAISLVILAVALYALYLRHLAGRWRALYLVTAVAALYLNVFVLIVQLFQKVPALQAVAAGIPPTGPVFGAVQGAALLFFVVTGFLAVKRFHPA